MGSCIARTQPAYLSSNPSPITPSPITPSPSTPSSSAPSPLLALPAELRNAIYEEVFRTFTTFEIVPGGHVKDEPGLLTVSRQVSDEALPVFLQNAFVLIGAITSRVHNFDFTDAIALFNIAVKTGAVKHRLEQIARRKDISLRLMMDDDWRMGKEGLTTWLRFVSGTLGG